MLGARKSRFFGGKMKIHIRSKAVLALAGLMVLGACGDGGSGRGEQPVKARPIIIQTGSVESITSMIDDSVNRNIAATNDVAHTTRSVVSVHRARPGEVLEPAGKGRSSGGLDATAPGVVLPPDAMQPVSLHWNGDAQGALSRLAGRAGYRLHVSGKAPNITPTMSVVADEEPLHSVVARVAREARGYADVTFDHVGKVIKIRYRG